MRYTSDEQRRYAFRDWLRAELALLDFYQRRGDRYLVSQFAQFATAKGARVEEVSLGRYLRDENPVLPTPESCRELARALDRHPAEVLMQAGYLTPDDFFYLPSVSLAPDEMERQREEINHYTYLPEAIRTQMQASLDRQMQLMQLPTSGLFADEPPNGGYTESDAAKEDARVGQITEAPTSILPPDAQPISPSVAANSPSNPPGAAPTATPNVAHATGAPSHYNAD